MFIIYVECRFYAARHRFTGSQEAMNTDLQENRKKGSQESMKIGIGNCRTPSHGATGFALSSTIFKIEIQK